MFTNLNSPTSWHYTRFKGTSNLSTNLEAWKNHCGFISYNMPYSNDQNGALTKKAYEALKWLSKNNKFYKNIKTDRQLFDIISEIPNKRVLADFNGQLFLKVISKKPNKDAGNEDFEFERLPLAMKNTTFKKIEDIPDDVQNTVADIVSATKGNRYLESLLFFNLYPNGEGGLEINEKRFIDSGVTPNV